MQEGKDQMTSSDWDKAQGSKCPSCGEETLRFVGKVCPGCARRIPDELAQKLTKIGLPGVVDGTTIRAALFEHEIQLGFSPEQSIIYYQPARQAERKLFRGLESDLKRWAHQKGLAFATKEGIEPSLPGTSFPS